MGGRNGRTKAETVQSTVGLLLMLPVCLQSLGWAGTTAEGLKEERILRGLEGWLVGDTSTTDRPTERASAQPPDCSRRVQTGVGRQARLDSACRPPRLPWARPRPY